MLSVNFYVDIVVESHVDHNGIACYLSEKEHSLSFSTLRNVNVVNRLNYNLLTMTVTFYSRLIVPHQWFPTT